MTTIKLFNIDREKLPKAELEVNGFMMDKKVTKVFFSPGYQRGD